MMRKIISVLLAMVLLFTLLAPVCLAANDGAQGGTSFFARVWQFIKNVFQKIAALFRGGKPVNPPEEPTQPIEPGWDGDTIILKSK